MGAVTGKGLADLIRENFGVRLTFYVMVLLLLADLGNTVAEFAGVAASLEIFGLSRYAMLLLINRRDLMGQYTNGTAMNAAAWVMVIVTSGLSLYLAAAVFFGRT